jgi:hypothetical protein
MSATHINRWLDATDTAPRARDLGLSALVTAALFAVAFGSMTTLRNADFFRPTGPGERVQWVPVPTPASKPAPLPPPRIARVRPPRAIAPAEPAPVARDVAPAPRLQAPPADTAMQPTAAPPANIPLSIEPAKTVPYVPTTARGGAPISLAAVGGHAPMTARMRDSILAASMAEVPYLAGPRSPNAVKIPPRPNGEPAIGGGMSIPVPIFEPGPSAAQRKRDAVVAAENQARLYRLEDRLFQKRDSIRLDSLRRDSIAAKRKPTAPEPP